MFILSSKHKNHKLKQHIILLPRKLANIKIKLHNLAANILKELTLSFPLVGMQIDTAPLEYFLAIFYILNCDPIEFEFLSLSRKITVAAIYEPLGILKVACVNITLRRARRYHQEEKSLNNSSAQEKWSLGRGEQRYNC